MAYYLQVSQWGGHFLAKNRRFNLPRHYYGTIRDVNGDRALEIFGQVSRRRVIEIAREWAGKNKLVVRRKTLRF